MFYYFPIEPYEERYSTYLSSVDGFWETFLKENKIQFTAFRPWGEQARSLAGNGAVLDTFNRSKWAMTQVMQFLQQLDFGKVKDGDVLYIEDFWHPGFEAIPYARDMYKVDFKIYAWLHAQSVDPSDFTAIQGMAPWMRYFEQGIAESLDGIFVADAGLKEMLLNPPLPLAVTDEYHQQKLVQSYHPGKVDQCPIHAIGTCWNTQWIREKYNLRIDGQREKLVVFASRWDKEKNPSFYTSLAQSVMKERNDIKFVVTTGFKKLTSNDPMLVVQAYQTQEKWNKQFEVLTDVSKRDYMRLLGRAKVHFNCAEHDWISYALCESVSMGALPLFPDHKAFPLALQFDLDHIYRHLNIDDAKRKLYKLIDAPDCSEMWPEDILRRFDNSIAYAAHIMGLK